MRRLLDFNKIQMIILKHHIFYQSTDENILVKKKSAEPNMHAEAGAKIKNDNNASDSTNMIDVSAKRSGF